MRLRDTSLHSEKIKAITIIQKFLKGYRVAKEVEKFYVYLRFTRNIEYFEDVKRNLVDDA